MHLFEEHRVVNGLAAPLSVEKVSGIPGAILFLSIIPEIILENNRLNSIVFGRYALTVDVAKGRADEWIDGPAYESEAEKILSLVRTNGTGFLQKIADTIYIEGHRFRADVYSLGERLVHMTDEELAAAYESMLRTYFRVYGYGGVTFVYEAYVSDWLSRSLATQFDNVAQIAGELLCTGYSSFMLESDRALQAIADAADSEKGQRIGEYRQNFYYMNASYLGAPILTEAVVLKKVASLHPETVVPHKSAVPIDVSLLSPRDRDIVAVLRISEVIRDIRKQVNLVGDWALARFADEIARRTGLDARRMSVLTWYELVETLTNPHAVERIIESRKSYTLAFDDGHAHYAEGTWVEKERIDTTVVEIRGTPASKGAASGVVRVIGGPETFDMFQEGEILVTEMTRPDFIPLMKRARAILTDEGGLTCHAAIVSRELHIPCVVGLKTATRILCDGDEVEIDANRGIVRVLNR